MQLMRVVSHGVDVIDDQKMFDYIEGGGNMFARLSFTVNCCFLICP